MTAAANANTPIITGNMRKHWAREVLSMCLALAHVHGITERHEEGATDLQELPPAIHESVFGKCQELIERACRADARGKDSKTIQQLANGELWDFLKTWRRDDVIESRLNAPRETL